METPENRSKYAGVKYIESTNVEIDQDLRNWQELLESGYVLIFRSAVSRTQLRHTVSSILRTPQPLSHDTRVVQGVGNIRYAVQHPGGDSSYSCSDESYYFFPWNHDPFGLYDLVQPAFLTVARLNGYDPTWLMAQEPKDGVVQRFHMICYPEGSGHISTHLDPVKVTSFTSGIYVTQYGRDYIDGGYYIIDGDGCKVVIDPMVQSGDMVVFPAHFAHGVDTVRCVDKESEDDLQFRGRIFVNMTVIESHEVADRTFTQPFRP